MKTVGVRSEFHSQRCYQLYLYAVGLAQQVNDYIEKGFLLFNNDGGIIKRKLLFYHSDEPCILEQHEAMSSMWIGGVYDTSDRIIVSGEYTKKSIRMLFSEIMLYDPKDKKKLCLD